MPSGGHLGEQSIDERGEILVHHGPVPEFGEGPTAKAAERVDARNPEIARRLGLRLVAFVPDALHLKHEVERLVAAVVEPDQEVGQVAPRDAAIEIGDLEAQRLVLGVG